MNVIGLILGLGLLLFTVYEIASFIKDVKLKRSLKKDINEKNNKGGVDE